VDQTDLAEAARLRRSEIVVDDARHVARQERVEIEAILDRELDGFVGVQSRSYNRGPAITCCCQC
jgi:hypothetical protein